MRKLRVAYHLANDFVPSVDFSQPQNGNPGTGAAQYLHVAIPFYLQNHEDQIEQAIIIAPHIDLLPPEVECHRAATISDAARLAKELDVDFFVFRPRQHEEDSILTLIDDLKLPSIGRAALTPYPPHQRRLAASRYFKALVCVGRVQYDQLCDTPLSNKIALIENGVFAGTFKDFEHSEKETNSVVYLGALTQQKGFHILAQAWPNVLQEFPSATLTVIGSAKTYREESSVGPLGVAEKKYETTQILPYLATSEKRLLTGVKFLGNLGIEKIPILQRASVGIANPGGATETSCVAAIELQAAGTPVVSGAYFALLDTVKNGQTGLLGRSVADLEKNIIKLLRDRKLSTSLGQQAQAYARGRYDMSVIGPKWTRLFLELKEGRTSVYRANTEHLFRHQKWARLLNRVPQNTVGRLVFWPSLSDIEWLARKIKAALKTW